MTIYTARAQRDKYLTIPISLDYGAEEYLWQSHFLSSQEVIDYWLSGFDLSAFEKTVTTNTHFKKMISDKDQDDFYDYLRENNLHIVLIDGLSDLSYLICGEKKIFHNGVLDKGSYNLYNLYN